MLINYFFLSASDSTDISQALSLTSLVLVPTARSSGALFGGVTRTCGRHINRLCVNSAHTWLILFRISCPLR